MLNQKFLNLPIWVWVIIVGAIFYTCYYNTTNNNQVRAEAKESFADSSKEIKIYNFNTNWCGYSKQFQNTWDNFMKMTGPNTKHSNVIAKDIKCDNSSNDSMCQEYNVPGYPYVIAEINGKRIPYQGERTIDGLVSFVTNL